MVTLLVAYWPLLVVCSGMVLAAVIDGWKLKVPNRLTFALILSGWVLGLLHDGDQFLAAGQGGFLDSLAGTALGMVLLLPMYAIGGMGAGDVKMQMGFGSWIGAYYGISSGSTVILYAFCAGAIVGGVLGIGMILLRGQLRVNLLHVRNILTDFVTAGSIRVVAQRANDRRPRWHKLPYGIPLCIGFLGYLVWMALGMG